MISKIMGFIKNRPIISGVAGVAVLALVVSAFAGTAPVVVPALLAGLKSALTGAGGNLIVQVLKNKFAGNPAFKDIDWGMVAKTGLTAGALGAVGKVLSIGLGYIVKAFDPVLLKTTKAWDHNGQIGGYSTETPGIKGKSAWTGNVDDTHLTGATKVTDSYGNYQTGGAVAKSMKSNPALREVIEDLLSGPQKEKAKAFLANISPQDLASITPKGKSQNGIEIATEIAKTLMNSKR
jgi:hypothetical protein